MLIAIWAFACSSLNACYSTQNRHYYSTLRSTNSMQIATIIRSAALTGAAVFLMAASARAATITFNTAQTGSGGSGFNGTGNLVLHSSSGVGGTLAFVPDMNSINAIPGNVNFGNFTLACANC